MCCPILLWGYRYSSHPTQYPVQRESVHIFIDNGSGKHRKVLHLNLSELNEKQRNALIGFRAFSGKDYVSSFFKKSKRSWEIVKTNEKFPDLFCNLGEGPMTDEIYTGLEKKFQTVNDARSALFWKKITEK